MWSYTQLVKLSYPSEPRRPNCQACVSQLESGPALQREKAMRSSKDPTLQLEKAHVQQQRPSTANKHTERESSLARGDWVCGHMVQQTSDIPPLGASQWRSDKEPTCQCRRCKRHGVQFSGRGNGNLLNIPAWRIPRTEEPGELQSMGSQSPTPLSTHMPPPASSFSSFILGAQESWGRQDGEQKMMLQFSFLCSRSGVVEGQRVTVKLIEKLSNLNNSGFCQPSPPQRNLT